MDFHGRVMKLHITRRYHLQHLKLETLEMVLKDGENLKHGDITDKPSQVPVTWEVIKTLRDNLKQRQWTKV